MMSKLSSNRNFPIIHRAFIHIFFSNFQIKLFYINMIFIKKGNTVNFYKIKDFLNFQVLSTKKIKVCNLLKLIVLVSILQILFFQDIQSYKYLL